MSDHATHRYRAASRLRGARLGASFSTLCLLFFASGASPAAAQIAVRGETVHTMAGAAIPDGVVLIRDGKIERVGPAAQVPIPAGYRTMQARVVTPGLVDARSVV